MTTEQEAIRRQTHCRADRFEVAAGAPTMKAVVTLGNGGRDKLDYRDVPVPVAGPGEVLLRVLAAGVNTTEINTRLGWYSASVTADTEATASDQETAAVAKEDGGWSEPTPFPLIQGTDCCGRVVAVGRGGDDRLLGRRALVRPCMRPYGFSSLETVWMASDFDGAFAEYVKVPASEVFAVESELSDVELGALPCAYGTAENMLHRAGVGRGQHVVVTGASGGVGAAAVQLAGRRGAMVTAVAGRAKADQVRALGADAVVDRDADLVAAIGEQAADVVVDNVSGPAFDVLVAVLKRGGRYVSSGAIAGPLVAFDKRTFYLRDLTLLGCTAWDEPVFADLVAYVERRELRPPIAKTYPLERIADAQAEFLEKRHVGKFVLVPPPGDD
jgi:NADPH:quinone reductase-like Zn-dependent oxidoreductase